MDPLSDVLALLKPRSYMCRGFDIGGSLAFQFGQHDGIKCYAVESGRCLLLMENLDEPIELQAGDCFLLPRGLPFTIGTDLSLPAVDAMQAISSIQASESAGVVTFNGGGECFVVGGLFTLSGGHAEILTNLLPPIVHVRSELEKTELRWALRRMRQELEGEQPGSQLVAQQLAYMILVQALRLHLAERTAGEVGWLFALTNKPLKIALACMHETPSHPWRLQELAQRAGMSRSMFAMRFKEAVGETPMEYLTRWRMLIASERLLHSDDAVTDIASSLGYESESAFRRAFRKIMGCSPRRYGRAQKTNSSGGPGYGDARPGSHR